MKIAVTYENDKVFQHFGHTESFKIYEVENDDIKSMKIISANGSGHGALAGFLKEQGVDVLICGGIGAGAQNALNDAGIKWFGGVQGDCNQAVISFLLGKLQYNPDVKCSHHEGHGEGHTCGDHGCDSNCEH